MRYNIKTFETTIWLAIPYMREIMSVILKEDGILLANENRALCRIFSLHGGNVTGNPSRLRIKMHTPRQILLR
jgi:hypothetical protein